MIIIGMRLEAILLLMFLPAQYQVRSNLNVKILHLSPTYFDSDSVIGGAERYVYELAAAMARKTEVHLVSFGGKKFVRTEGNLTIRNLVSPGFGGLLREIIWADVIHCHQIYRWQTDFSLIVGKILGRKVFATDLGGPGRRSLAYHFPILKFLDGLLFISEFSKKVLEMRLGPSALPQKKVVIWGGVNLEKIRQQSGPRPRSQKVLFVGRLLSHKGIDVLIDAADPGMEIEIVGNRYDENYFSILQEKAKGKNVKFHFHLSDQELFQKYAEALVTVLPSVYRTCDGYNAKTPELLGLAVLESLAAETPAIVTDVASLPEIVTDGQSGFIVPPNDPAALARKIRFLMDNPETAVQMGKKGRENVEKKFTWNLTAERCLKAYAS